MSPDYLRNHFTPMGQGQIMYREHIWFGQIIIAKMQNSITILTSILDNPTMHPFSLLAIALGRPRLLEYSISFPK